MPVKITFFGPLERWAGKKHYHASGNTVKEVFQSLESQLGKSLIDHIINQDTGRIKSHFHVLLNGKDIELLNGLEEKVTEGDTITCVPPVGGGNNNIILSFTNIG
ncbi:MAG: MoaD/ThiS family protein [Candidatus Hodarchaeota archaeon]